MTSYETFCLSSHNTCTRITRGKFYLPIAMLAGAGGVGKRSRKWSLCLEVVGAGYPETL
jgi:hypothetical protein